MFEARQDDGAIIRIRQHGNPDGPRLVLSHGNGLAMAGYVPVWAPLAERARRRTARYKDPSILAAQFRARFPKWRPEAYELMARATLRLDANAGDWILACPREFEANIFSTNADPTLWQRLGQVPVPM